MIWFRAKKEVLPKIFTELTCEACGEKTRKLFEQGDYVFRKSTDAGDSDRFACKKCGSRMTIVSAIYGEYPPEKTKT